jgi:hypothetical protein
VIVEFKVRRDSAASWATYNPVLSDGEPGWDKDNRVLKIGDGVTPWTNLPTAKNLPDYLSESQLNAYITGLFDENFTGSFYLFEDPDDPGVFVAQAGSPPPSEPTDPAAPHDHDSRYYTEAETNTLLASKSDTTHNHDSRYYTESEVDVALAGKAGVNHTHSSLTGTQPTGAATWNGTAWSSARQDVTLMFWLGGEYPTNAPPDAQPQDLWYPETVVS